MSDSTGRHLLQIPGPTNVPDRILRAMAAPTIDHRGPAFVALTREVLEGLKRVFKTRGPVLVFPASGTGAWEAALVNTLSPRDRVVMCETGHFAALWGAMAQRLGLVVEMLAGDWRHGSDAAAIEAALAADRGHAIKAVAVVHNETSTGVTSRIGEIRAAIDRTGHPALLLVDVISSLASIDVAADDWRADVTIGASQKGLMLPPGLGFNAISDAALAANRRARLGRAYWDWRAVLEANQRGLFPYTPATNLLIGLAESIRMIEEIGLAAVLARHRRHGEATRRAVAAWGLELQAADPSEYSESLTAVRLPEGNDADRLRALILQRFDMSLGNGLGRLAGRVFRIGHLGAFNDLMLAATLSGVEMGLALAGVPHRRGGMQAALDHLIGAAPRADPAPAGAAPTGAAEDAA